MNFCGIYDKQLAKQQLPSVVTPLWAGWEFWQRAIPSVDRAGLVELARTQDWALTKSIHEELWSDKWAVVITDIDQMIQYVNTRFEQMTGYERHEILGNRPTMLQGEQTSLKSRQRIRKALSLRKPVREHLVNYRKDRTTYLCHVTIKPIFNQQKQLVNFVAFEQEIIADAPSV